MWETLGSHCSSPPAAPERLLREEGEGNTAYLCMDFTHNADSWHLMEDHVVIFGLWEPNRSFVINLIETLTSKSSIHPGYNENSDQEHLIISKEPTSSKISLKVMKNL